ncbi:MAG TPA: DUF4149 domain-containing protein [Vicinamibacterales bacterium]|nr:DUF4149 domain-containing protein [Vicinamibacterales bacterium]
MLALRYAGLIAVAVWVGGLLGLAAVGAPAIFETIDARHVPDGRVLSGAIFGEVLRRFHLVAYGCGGIVLGSLAARAVLGPRPRRFAVRAGIATAMLAASLYSGLVVSARIARSQQELGVAPSSLHEDDPRRAAFGRLHGQSTLLQLVPILGGLVLMLFELRD